MRERLPLALALLAGIIVGSLGMWLARTAVWPNERDVAKTGRFSVVPMPGTKGAEGAEVFLLDSVDGRLWKFVSVPANGEDPFVEGWYFQKRIDNKDEAQAWYDEQKANQRQRTRGSRQ